MLNLIHCYKKNSIDIRNIILAIIFSINVHYLILNTKRILCMNVQLAQHFLKNELLV